LGKIKIPYYKGFVELDTSGENVSGILEPACRDYSVSASEEEIVQKSLSNPINSQRLCALAKESNNILVITSDHTRPVPSKITMPIILREIRALNKNARIKILVATGFHRATTSEELRGKFGEEIVKKEEVVVHDSRDKGSMVYKGKLPSGGELHVNSLVDWADMVIAEGFIEPHFFAGFSGGRKSILPGIASTETVLYNHNAGFIGDKRAKAGILKGNPIHKDMVFAAKAAGLRFIINVVIDGQKKIINAFSGDAFSAHEEGCRFVSGLAEVNRVPGDIVITSNGGYPLDQNIYQAVKGMTAAESCVKENGVIIMVASCCDGHGGEDFYRWFKEATDPEEVYKKIEGIAPEDTLADQWEAQILARITRKNKVIIVSDMCDENIIKDMHLYHAKDINEGLEVAKAMIDRKAELVIIPDGVGVIVR